MAIFFTSDTHYWHKNIIEFSKRPYGSLEQMHAGLIKNWNEVVSHEDTVYHLGDVSFSGRGNTMMILGQLKGHIKFIRGNHDKKSFARPGLDEDLGTYHELTHQSKKIILCHFPLLTWNKASHGSWMLHGHCHGSLDKTNLATTRLDVGVDGIASYYPLSFDNVAAIMADRQYQVVDSHGRNPYATEA
jgi:calcineurin-like phosphoesterase family protein